MRYRFP